MSPSPVLWLWLAIPAAALNSHSGPSFDGFSFLRNAFDSPLAEAPAVASGNGELGLVYLGAGSGGAPTTLRIPSNAQLTRSGLVWTDAGQQCELRLPASISVSRVIKDSHYLTDVVVGSLLGYWIGDTLAKRHQGLFPDLQVLPMASRDGGGVTISGQF